MVEDDPDIALSLRYNLEKDGACQVTVAENGEAGLEAARRRAPDLVLLDLNLPGMDGLDVCRRLRGDTSTAGIPVIMLTARVEEADKVSGLELGADDYLSKPFSMQELKARIRAVLRRTKAEPEAADALAAGPVTVDVAGRRVSVGEREVSLTRKEFDLLVALIRARGRVLSRDRLLESVWGYDHPGETRTVDVHVRQLRRKLGSPADRLIETVVGVGYRLGDES